MDKNILVIGNGFDLYHGLPTHYIDFVNYTKQICEQQPSYNDTMDELEYYGKLRKNMFIRYFQGVASENQTWIDCEQEIKRAVAVTLKAMHLSELNEFGQIEVDVKGLSRSERNILEKMEGIFYITPGSLTMMPRREYIHTYYELNKDIIFQDMKSELENLVKALENYLLSVVHLDKISIRSKQISAIRPAYVINFNYTDTYKLYGIKDEDVFFIHGRADSDPNNMVLGFEDEDEKNLDNIYFKKYFQRIQKMTGVLDERRFEVEEDIWSAYPAPSNTTISHFFGLSMSKTDGDMIQKISQLSDRIKIYYLDQRDYEQKIVNLIDVFGKNTAVEKIQFGEIEMVQIE